MQLDLCPGQWGLLILPRSRRANVLTGLGHLAEHGPLLVLDGGNWFNAYTVSRAVRGKADVLTRIRVSRAFTCYQMVSLLDSLSSAATPIICLDFLTTFFDESLPTHERRRLLETCLLHFAHLGKSDGMLVVVSPPKVILPETAIFLEILENAAGSVWAVELPPTVPEPLRLF